jgi:hypothetical protein
MRREELLRTGRIRRETVSPAEIREALKLAARDLRLARKILHEETITYFDRMRAKRNVAIYGMAGRVVESEARTLPRHAERFVKLIRQRIPQRP